MSRASFPTFWWKATCGWVLLSFVLAGCGGSHDSATPTVSSTAVITQTNSGNGANPGYSISLSPSGDASYTKFVLSGPGRTGSGTVSASLTSRFFQDLSAATPLQNLPIYSGPSSGISTSMTVEYQGQKGPIDNPNDAREKALSADASAIAQTLSLSP